MWDGEGRWGARNSAHKALTLVKCHEMVNLESLQPGMFAGMSVIPLLPLFFFSLFSFVFSFFFSLPFSLFLLPFSLFPFFLPSSSFFFCPLSLFYPLFPFLPPSPSLFSPLPFFLSLFFPFLSFRGRFLLPYPNSPMSRQPRKVIPPVLRGEMDLFLWELSALEGSQRAQGAPAQHWVLLCVCLCVCVCVFQQL